MILKSLRIEHFKCIEDSTEFTLQPVTCLVGKNEAGKTTLIQALYKLNPDIKEKENFDPLEDYPRRKWSEYKERYKTNPDNVLTTKWELQEADTRVLEEKFGAQVLNNNTVTITKGYDNKRRWVININEKAVIKNCLNFMGLGQEAFPEIKELETICDIIKKLNTKTPTNENEKKLLEHLKKMFGSAGDTNESFISELEKRLPIFLFFAESFRMAGEVSINDFLTKKSHNSLDQPYRIFEALLNLAGTDADGVNKIGRFEELIAELEAISSRLSQEIFEYWSQNKYLRVEFRFDSGRPQDPAPLNSGFVFRTRIENTRHDVTVSFNERSAGFVWFFSFLIWFSQLKKTYGEHLFILLDDPGLSLHARAQKDLLRYINEKLKPDYQIVYTTHSPFMINPDNCLVDVRTVEDVEIGGEVLGTKVGDKVLGVDPDTIFPLQAALGYDITQTLFIGKYNLLVEGPADLLYMKLFSHELQERKREFLDPRWVITPCGGIGNIGSFIALFGGKELFVAVFTDYHKGLKNKIRSLRELNILKTGHIFSAEMYAGAEEADIEDVIGRSNYIALVNECYSLDGVKKLPEKRPSNLTCTVIEEVENHFKSQLAVFDHYAPSLFLVENRNRLRDLPDLDQVLSRFERFFSDVNKLLPKQ